MTKSSLSERILIRKGNAVGSCGCCSCFSPFAASSERILIRKGNAVGSCGCCSCFSPFAASSERILIRKGNAVGSCGCCSCFSPFAASSERILIRKGNAVGSCGCCSCFSPFACLLISSHPPFQKDLTINGDVESNPGPLSKDSLEYLNPGQWIDDDAIFQYCQYLFNSARLAFDLYSIPSSVMNGLITDLSPEHKQTVDRQILIAKTTGTRFLIAPINDGMTALSASRTFSGSHWGVILLDCVQNVATVIDPILNSNFLNHIVDKFREKMPSFTIRYANVPKSQTPSDCGIYVIAYVQKYLQILTTHESLSNLSTDFF
ncbi:hypothetical protein GEMRC1_001731 [Eukaryota sp. GEM-RC1]